MNRSIASVLVLVAVSSTMAWSSQAQADPVATSFEGDRRGQPLTLHLHGGWSSDSGWSVPQWRTVCTSPCKTQLEPGQYRIALSAGSGEPVEGSELITVTQPSYLRGIYISRKGVRTAGYVALFAGPALGGFLWLPHIGRDDDISDTAKDERRVTKYAAIGVTLGGIIGGMIMTVIPDRARVMVFPMSTPGVEGASLRLRDELPTGLMATARF